MRLRRFVWPVLLVGLCLLCSCATRDANLISASYNSADSIMDQARTALDPGRPILVAPFMSVKDLHRYTAFGSLTAEQMSSRLAQQGFQILEVKLDWRALYNQQGPSSALLSDELRNLTVANGAQAVLIGTYALGAQNVYVSVRLVRVADNMVVASGDYALPLGPDTTVLTGDPDSPPPQHRSRFW